MVMKSERTGHRLIEMWKAKLGGHRTLEQQLVLTYFEKNVEDLPVDYGDPTSFHKAFRQIDICRKGYQDMIIWSFLSGGESDELWAALEDFYA